MFTKGNLRKNFLRVKQSADQKLGRVEKTEVLSDDLQTSEKRVELVKHVSSNTVKKLGGSLLVSGTQDVDKRQKRMPEAGLAHGMIESANILGTDDIMGQMYQMCGDCQNTLARNHLDYENEIEKDVLGPLQDIVESEIPQIAKLKKALTKVTLDMDSAKSRWNNAVRQTQAPGVNMASMAAKADTVKEELDESESRVDQAKDAYTTGIFNFIARGTEHSKNLLHLLEAQAHYHEQALDIINQVIPKMRESLTCNPVKPVYGLTLEEHLRVTNRDIAQVLEACICYLMETGLEEEGLFRIAGMASKVKKLKASFDAGVDFEETGELDPHTVAGALKQYLRELPEPLLTFDKFPEFMAAAQLPSEQRLQALWTVVDTLPKPNYDNFRYLIKFLAKLTERSEVNKMTPSNVAIVIGPNLIWSEGDNGPNMMNTGILSLITELIVQHADWFFTGDVNFSPSNNYGNESPQAKKASESAELSPHQVLERTSSDQSAGSSSLGTPPQSSPAPSREGLTAQATPQTPPISSRSPSVSPVASNTNLTTGAPIAESEDLQQLQQPVMRRQPRKPAPPPPPERPERPYSVAVSASVKGTHSVQFQTWPRQTSLPTEDPDSLGDNEKTKTLPHDRPDRPNPPERVSSLPGSHGHHHHADRPKVPPPVVPPTHKRSASTGATVVIPGGHLDTTNSDSSTGSSPYLPVQQAGVGGAVLEPSASTSNQHSQLIQQQQPPTATCSSSNNSLPRQSVCRPARPLPPPPPPPPDNTIVEQTHL